MRQRMYTRPLPQLSTSIHACIMVFHALSEKIKKIKKRRAEDAALRKAAEVYLEEQEKPKKERRGLRKIAEVCGIKERWRSIGRLVKGGKTMNEFNISKQKLSPPEEHVLVVFLNESAQRGFPLNHCGIEMYANAVLQKRQGPDFESVGNSWVFNFLTRHHDELSTYWSRPLDTQRANSLNPQAVKAWFEIVRAWIIDLGIRPEDIYGMDESGFPPSDQGRQRVIGGPGIKTQHKQGSANRENVTAVVTICADGTALKPMIIFKAKHFMKAWGDDNVANAA